MAGNADKIPKLIDAITPSDSNTLAFDALRVYSAAGCTIRVTAFNETSIDTDYVLLTFPAGLFVEPLSVKRVWNTGLTGSPTIHGYKY